MKRWMIAWAGVGIWAMNSAGIWGADGATPAGDYAALVKQAESLMAEKSFAAAREVWQRAGKVAPDETEARRVRFRVADCGWRAEAANPGAEMPWSEEALRELTALAEAGSAEDQRDEIWAEVVESLGDYHWLRPTSRDWKSGWNYYQQALGWWAGSQDVDRARDRYLSIVFRASVEPEGAWSVVWLSRQMPVEVLENAMKIARDPVDRARATYLWLLQMSQQVQSSPVQHRRIADAFEEASSGSQRQPWMDDLLFLHGRWLEQSGRLERVGPGNWVARPDFAKALAAYRKLVDLFPATRSKYTPNAVQRIKEITEPALTVSVSGGFLPGSDVSYQVNWRNLGETRWTLRRLEAGDVARLTAAKSQWQLWIEDWIGAVKRGQVVREWKEDLSAKVPHEPGAKMEWLPKKLEVGAYLLEAKAGKVESRSLVLVSDLTVLTQTYGAKSWFWVVDALSGQPVADAVVDVWMIKQVHAGKSSEVHHKRLQTNADGVAQWVVPQQVQGGRSMLVCAHAGNRVALSRTYARGHSGNSEEWRAHVMSDRPVYRPGDLVRWKTSVRRRGVEGWETPEGETVSYEILSPRGDKVKQGKLELNAFGSAWDELELDETSPLGEYQIVMKREGEQRVSAEILFRLEEYKLPEFKVSVNVGKDGQGRPKVVLSGEPVEVEITAEYFFGGPVSGAEVEVLVRNQPFAPRWSPLDGYGWFYDAINGGHRGSMGRGWHGSHMVQHHQASVERRKLRLDAEGRATLTLDSPFSDVEMNIEARVTDASRREVVGVGRVRVSEREFFAKLETSHQLHQPGAKAEIILRVRDANEQPKAVEGELTIWQLNLREVWLDPAGREVSGQALLEARRSASHWPPQVDVETGRGWRLKSSLEERKEVFKTKLATGADGQGRVEWVVKEEGFFVARWLAEDQRGETVREDTRFWCATDQTRFLEVKSGDLELVVDRESFKEGGTAAVMLMTRQNQRAVWLSVETARDMVPQVLQMEGTVRLVTFPVTAAHVPNFFVHGWLVQDARLHTVRQELRVPPIRHFLEVQIEPDREDYRPGDTAKLRVKVTDAEGKPRQAEVAVGLVDEAVYAIAADQTKDARTLFYGDYFTSRIDSACALNEIALRRVVKPVEKDHDESPGDMGAKDELGYEGMSQYRQKPRESLPPDALSPGLMMSERSPILASMVRDEGTVREAKGAAAGEPDGGESIAVRSDFRATAFWQPDVVTDAQGRAEVSLTMPESLTAWRAVARGIDAGSRVGQGTGEALTNMPLMVRLQTPRFLVTGDTLLVSALVDNRSGQNLSAQVNLDAKGVKVLEVWHGGKSRPGSERTVAVKADETARVDWRIQVEQPGAVVLTARAQAKGGLGDAMTRTLKAELRGLDKAVTHAGRVRQGSANIQMLVPAERVKESTRLEVRVAPSLAVTMLDALPYLIDYPYGCVEQTMSRFLPAAIVAKTLRDQGISPEIVHQRIFGGIESASAKKLHGGRGKSLAKLDRIVAQGIKRLLDFQKSDGSWGWWKESPSDDYMTGYVLWGLALAQESGLQVPGVALRRGVNYVDRRLPQYRNNPAMQAWLLHAVAHANRAVGRKAASDSQTTAFKQAYAGRETLAAQGKALLAMAAHRLGRKAEAEVLVRNLADGVRRDESPDTSVVMRGPQQSLKETMATAHWGQERDWWRWHDGAVESTSFVLRALVAVQPDSPLIEPAMNWLVRNRRGAQWTNTRDTAIAVLALNDFLVQSGELKQSVSYRLRVNGKEIAAQTLRPDQLLSAPALFALDHTQIRDGVNPIEIIRTGGEGNLYFSATAYFFSLENPVTPSGHELFVRRQYFRIVPRPTLLSGWVEERVPLNHGAALRSGDRIETVITLETKNDAEYLLVEDLKPSGFEAVELTSGGLLDVFELKKDAAMDSTSRGRAGEREVPLHRWTRRGPEHSEYTGRTVWAYPEWRDRKVALFMGQIPQGIWEVRYQVRAETPGNFSALPVKGHAMYVPEIRANGAEIRVEVTERE